MNEDNCPICLRKISKRGRTKIRLDCGHEFHWRCVWKWVKQQKNTCPICRGFIYEPEPIFFFSSEIVDDMKIFKIAFFSAFCIMMTIYGGLLIYTN